MSENENKWTPKEICAFPKLSGSENHKGFRIIARAGSRTLAEVMPIDEDGAVGKLFADKLVASYNACAGMADPAKEIERLKQVANDAIKELVRIHSDLHPTWALDPGNVKLTGANISEGITKLRADAATLAKRLEWIAHQIKSHPVTARINETNVLFAIERALKEPELARCREGK